MIPSFKTLISSAILLAAAILTPACKSPSPQLDNSDTQDAVKPVVETPQSTEESPQPTEESAVIPEETPAPDPVQPDPTPISPEEKILNDAIAQAQTLRENQDFNGALRLLLETEYKQGSSQKLDEAYLDIFYAHPQINAAPKLLIPDKDVTTIKRIGGGSSLVYKLLNGKDIIAAFKPFQKRFQSNYRAEIAAYRLCYRIKCGFEVPTNLPVYFDFQQFSGLYARLATNPPEEFKEIIPTKLPNGQYQVDGTFKDWIPDFADFPIEFKDIWMPWVNPGTTRADLEVPTSGLIPIYTKRHKGGNHFSRKLAPHLENLTKYDLARQISNLIVFDFLINNWDRFSGSPTLYGVNCQMSHGRFMSIDNGAAFPKTPNVKPDKHLHEISRFSRTTYHAILALADDRDRVNALLFPDPTKVELERLDTFWKQRDRFLAYVQECIKKNGEEETFFFE